MNDLQTLRLGVAGELTHSDTITRTTTDRYEPAAAGLLGNASPWLSRAVANALLVLVLTVAAVAAGVLVVALVAAGGRFA